MNLHSDDAVDEEDETDEDGDPGQSLEGFDEGPEKGSDALALAQQFDQSHDTEETEEVDGDHVSAGLEFYNWERKKRLNESWNATIDNSTQHTNEHNKLQNTFRAKTFAFQEKKIGHFVFFILKAKIIAMFEFNCSLLF